MDRDPPGQAPLTVAQAKQRLLEASPTLLPADPGDWIRKHPREAVAVGIALGVLIGASGKLRRGLLSAALDVGRVLIRESIH